jgi:hypothetical protein
MTTRSENIFSAPGAANVKPPKAAPTPPEPPPAEADPLAGTTPTSEPPPAKPVSGPLMTREQFESAGKALAPQKPEREPFKIVDGRAVIENSSHLRQIVDMVVSGGMNPVAFSKNHEGNEAAALGTLLLCGMERGLTVAQALAGMYILNGRPAMYVKTARALVLSSGHLADLAVQMKGEGQSRACVCTVQRKGIASPMVVEFGIQDAIRAGLTRNPTWAAYPDRMLRARAIGYALEDMFSDVLGGISIQDSGDEAEPAASDMTARLASVPDPNPVTVTHNGST